MVELKGPASWPELLEQRRWFPIGRPDWTDRQGRFHAADPKAPAFRHRTSEPGTWFPHKQIATPMAGLNFGPRDGLLGIDFDQKLHLLPDDVPRAEVGGRLRRIAEALPGPRELSHSRKGIHIFGWMSDDLMGWVQSHRGPARIKVTIQARRGDSAEDKDAAAVEIFGGGNAFIAVTQLWVKGTMNDEPLPVITLAMLRQAFGIYWPAPAAATEQPGLSALVGDAELAQRIADAMLVPQDYDTWVRAVSAMLNSGMSEQAVDGWCKRGAGYQAGEVAKRARSPMREPSIGWLVSWAKAQGVVVEGMRERTPWASAGAAPAPAVIDHRTAPAAPVGDGFDELAQALAQRVPPTPCEVCGEEIYPEPGAARALCVDHQPQAGDTDRLLDAPTREPERRTH